MTGRGADRAWLVVAVVVPVAVSAALVPARDSATSANLALIVLVGAVGVAVACNRLLPSVVCAVVAGVAYDVFLVRPYGSVTIAEPSEALTAALILVVVVVVATASWLLRRQRELRERREEDLGLLYQVVQQVATGAGAASLVENTVRELGELLGGAHCRYQPQLVVGPLDSYIDAIGEVHVEGVAWDTEAAGMPPGRLLLPVQSGGMSFGSVVVEPVAGSPVARWELIVAVTMADLVGAALARWPT